MPSLLRSALAVIVGYMVMMLLVIVLTLIMIKTMGLRSGQPTPVYLAYNVFASFVASFVGGFTTGSIAVERRVRHGYILGMVMMVMGALSYVHYRGNQPPWYQAMLIVIPPIFAVFGSRVAQIAASRR